MNKLHHVFRPCRLVLSIVSRTVIFLVTPVQGLCYKSTNSFLYNFQHSVPRKMSQKSITSFFKITPKKTDNKEDKKVEGASTPSPNKYSEEEKSPVPVSSGKEKRNSKRQRLDSSESDVSLETTKKPSPSNSEKKKKSKRLRIESSGSEPETPPVEEKLLEIKVESKPKTYESPRSKKGKAKLEKSPLAENVEVKEEKIEESPSPKKETKKRQSTAKTKASKAKVQKSPLVEKNGEKSPEIKKVKEEEDAGSKKAKTMSFFIKRDDDKKNGDASEGGAKVKEEEYNPAKPKYHPVDDACWLAGEPVPYLALAVTLEAIEATSARLRIVEILSNYLRSVIALTPEDLLPSVYMCLNQLAPAYHSLELGIAETYLMKAIGQCTGRSLAQVKAAAQKEGDLGRVAQAARASQRLLRPPRPLSARAVLAACRDIARMTGQASVNKKINKIQQLYTACRLSEAKYLIRSLEGKLRIGLAEQSVLQALALATALTPPVTGGGDQVLDASRGLSAEQLKARVDEHALTIKTTYCECPNYDLVIPALLQYGVAALPEHCRLTPGIPLKPMLAHPTKRVSEVFTRFEGQKFTCEWKYDGERAQIHVPAAEGEGEAKPDFARAAVFSRNQEDNTSKYPDIVRRLPSLLKDGVSSCVLDAEAVAYDAATQQILPFQILSTRKRKDAAEGDIKVQVCVFVFDVLYLNGQPLVRAPLAERRRLLRRHCAEVPGEWQFATSRDCSTAEEVQQFLEESVRGSCEGLMVKMLEGEHARYDIARRSHNWLKLKKDYLEGAGDSIDAVVIGGWWGRGKRAGVLGGFLLACRDADNDEFQSLCKIGTGFSDEDLKTLTEELKEHIIDSPKSYYRFDPALAPDVWLAAARVWEVRCADLSLSPAHRAAAGLVDRDKGISLRFPRFVRARDDKTPEQATDARQVAALYLAQDQVRNQAPAPANANANAALDDFY